jgi:two-component system, OmpR family, sensor kinase
VIRGRIFAPLVAAAIGLAGALGATLSLHHAAARAVDRVLEERLRGAGESAAALLVGGDVALDGERLRAVMRANELDGAYVLNPGLRVVADASGPSGRRADLLRLDIARLRAALAGTPSVAPGYAFGNLTVLTGYFPLNHKDSTGAAATDVLVLEAGQAFVASRASIERARSLGISLAIISALGLAMAATRWNRTERQRREAAARAARGEALSRVAAMAAHEIRNPLGVIRGTIDLMRERSASTLSERDRRALDDVSGEVERLRRLTQELLDLAADRPLVPKPTVLEELIAESARATEAAFPAISIRCTVPALPPILADATRLRQAFENLLSNAAHSQREGTIEVTAARDRRDVRVIVTDRGPGVPPELAERLFDLYFTTKSGGTGLGLAIARRFVEALGGTLTYLGDQKPGAAFEVRLPIASAAAPLPRED